MGCGKSTILYSLLQECYVSATTVSAKGDESIVSNGFSNKTHHSSLAQPFLLNSVSFCPQKPCLHSGTVKFNVLFQSEFDCNRYEYIMRGCCLHEDFNLSTTDKSTSGLHSTDEKLIGQGGSQLSGGQRLRVGIARALYARSEIVLLDDPLSALDSRTAHRVIRFLYRICREENRVLIIATNDVHLVCSCAKSLTEESSLSFSSRNVETSLYFVSGESRNIVSGSYSKLYDTSEEFRVMVDSESQDRKHIDETKDKPHDNALVGSEDDDKKSIICEFLDLEKANKEEETLGTAVKLEVEQFQRGYIHVSVVQSYLKAMGIGVVTVIIVSAISMQVIFLLFMYSSDR